ncbi:MAG: phosphoglycerate dehydrogenase [Eubacteriales bacterium]|nr:phosphoglycerate dehydrogenase [Eubacteriales bacterium]
MKVLITENIAKEGIEILEREGLEADLKLGLSREELLDTVGPYDAIIVRSVTKVNSELLGCAPNLKVVGRAGNGIDNIELPACTKRGIIVVNTPESNTMAAAELAIGLIFSVFRNIPQASAAGRRKDFRRKRFDGIELDGKTVGIIGLGRIGSIVATKLKGCNMSAVAYDPYITDERFKKLGVDKCETLEELLDKSDVITLHTPKTEETVGMIGEKEIARCKKGIVIINAARGGLVNEDALYNAVRSGHVRGAGIDVLNPEPGYDKSPEEQTYTNKLLELDNIIITPHLGASTAEATYLVGTAVSELVAAALKGEMVAAVNMPSFGGNQLKELKPYLELGEILGKIYYQAEKETVQKVEVMYSGELAQLETGIITSSVLKGLLDPIVREKVNYVNAEFLLREMGVEIVEGNKTLLDKYTNLITVTFHTKFKTLSVSGTVFAKEEKRIVDFFGYKLDFEPSSHIIAIQNIDKPGIIGQVGTILGAKGVNIAAMQWSRNRKGEKAVSFVSVDHEVDFEIMQKLRQIDGVLLATMMNF